MANDPLAYLDWDLNIVTDHFGVRSPLTGIHAGLFHMSKPYAFVAACDTPFLVRPLLHAIIAEIEPGMDVVIPQTEKGPQPLCAVYGKTCLKPIEKHLGMQTPSSEAKRSLQPGLKVQQFFGKVRVKRIPEGELRKHDADLTSFFNINTPEDLAQAETLSEKL